jgi:hypothetical protein
MRQVRGLSGTQKKSDRYNIHITPKHTFTHQAGILPSLYFTVPIGFDPAEAFFAAPVAALFAGAGLAPLAEAAFFGAGCLEVGARGEPSADLPGAVLGLAAAALWPGKAVPFCCDLFAAAFRKVEPAFCTASVLSGRVTMLSTLASGIACWTS